MRQTAAVLLSLFLATSPAFAQIGRSGSSWCGYALIENIPHVESYLPLLQRLTVDAREDSNPSDLFQYRVSLDGTKAIVEGCWLVTPTRDLIVNWLSLSGDDTQKESVDQTMTYSLFAPDQDKDGSAASVRQYLSAHVKEWELPEDVIGSGAETK